MRDIEKLLKKISKKEREQLLVVVDAILSDTGNTSAKKLTGSDFYRVRNGRFRIIFHYEGNKTVVIDSIRMRDEKTYRDF